VNSTPIEGKLDDTKVVLRNRKSKKDRQWLKEEGQKDKKMIHKTPHTKLKTKQQEQH
jgi:hypothetical protein